MMPRRIARHPELMVRRREAAAEAARERYGRGVWAVALRGALRARLMVTEIIGSKYLHQNTWIKAPGIKKLENEGPLGN